MTRIATHFIDPTIPGMSSSELIERASHSILDGCRAFSEDLAAWRREHAIRQALADLDTHQLRDLGLDRNAG